LIPIWNLKPSSQADIQLEEEALQEAM